jgi:hypothetical protein
MFELYNFIEKNIYKKNPPPNFQKVLKYPQTTKMYKKCHLFIYLFLDSYNIPILLTNKIIVKKTKHLKKKKTNGRINTNKKFFEINK